MLLIKLLNIIEWLLHKKRNIITHSASNPSFLLSLEDCVRELPCVELEFDAVLVVVTVGKDSAAAALSAKNFSNSLLVTDSSAVACNTLLCKSHFQNKHSANNR